VDEYDEARHDWHANFGILRTPQLAAACDELDLIVCSGRHDPDRVRGAAVIDVTIWPVLAISDPSWRSLAPWNSPQEPVLGSHDKVTAPARVCDAGQGAAG